MKELNSESLTTQDVESLLNKQEITINQACDLITNIDAGFDWDDDCINEMKDNKIQLSVNVYGWTDKDEKQSNFQYDEHIWLDSILVEFDIKTKEMKINISDFSLNEKTFFESKESEIEYAIVQNYETNFEEQVQEQLENIEKTR